MYTKYLKIYFSIIGIVVLSNLITIVVFFLEPKSFYYRPWEYFQEIGYRFSHYDATWDREETSDLTRKNYFYFQDPHKTYVSVDENGFRSNYKQNNYKILVAGDSTIFGSSLSDNETLPWRIAEKSNINAFNGGHANIHNLLLKNELSGVKLIVEGRTERYIKGDFLEYNKPNSSADKPLMINDKSIFNLLSEVPMQRYLLSSIIEKNIKRMINDFHYFNMPTLPEYKYIDHNMTEADFNGAVESIVKRSQYFKDKGFEYIFVPVPSKQTVYRDNVDDYSRTYIPRLVQALLIRGVHTVDLATPFIENKSMKLFHQYDTHWNTNGTDLASSIIVGEILKLKAFEADKYRGQ